jgi:hypothetical protein
VGVMVNNNSCTLTHTPTLTLTHPACPFRL